MDAYELHEARLVQEETAASGAGGTQVGVCLCPPGKIRTILAATYYPSVDETQVVWFGLSTKTTALFALTQPINLLLGQAIRLPLLTQGMEVKLFPGDYLTVLRAAATAGSVMTIIARYLETDLPYYSYEEPLKKVVKQSQRHGSVYRSGGGISSGGGGGGGGGGEAPSGGGGGGAEPI